MHKFQARQGYLRLRSANTPQNGRNAPLRGIWTNLIEM